MNHLPWDDCKPARPFVSRPRRSQVVAHSSASTLTVQLRARAVHVAIYLIVAFDAHFTADFTSMKDALA